MLYHMLARKHRHIHTWLTCAVVYVRGRFCSRVAGQSCLRHRGTQVVRQRAHVRRPPHARQHRGTLCSMSSYVNCYMCLV